MNELTLKILQITAENDSCDSVWWRTDGEYAPVTFIVNCNDVFYWGCSDAETITEENITDFEQSFEDAKSASKVGEIYAPILFCARVRKMRPQGAMYKTIPIELWDLFNQCGPERETGIGNPNEIGE